MTGGARKVIISCAVTGRAHTPSMSDFLPFTPERIAEQAVEAARAGAAVLHLDARNPADGSPAPSTGILEGIAASIRQQTDAIIAAPAGEPTGDIQTLSMGAVSHSYRKAFRGISDWKFDWEKSFVDESENLFLGNTLGAIKAILARPVSDGRGAPFLYECHDPSHLYNLAYCAEEGLASGPFFIQFHIGMVGGLGSDPENVSLMRSTADRLFGRENYAFSVAAHGRRQIPLAALAAIAGGHVRVGLADSLYLGKGLLAESCAAQVLKIRRILEDLSFAVASASEAREIMGADRSANRERVTGEARPHG